jgi:UDP-2-acetamido-3-amino-2,3-dideoxy-glucuronate N-acetyltransferase
LLVDANRGETGQVTIESGMPSIAVVGAGRWGSNHLRVWSQLGALGVVADSDIRRLLTAQAEYPTTEVSSAPLDAVMRTDVDAVVIASPAATHHPMAKRALLAGKDVLVEKPLALSYRDGAELVELATRTDRVLMVGHVLEYHPAVRKLHELAAGGDLGKVRYLYSNRLSFGQLRTEESALWSFAPHDVAICLRLIGAYPDEVSCRGGSYLNPGVVDVSLMSLGFPSDVRAHIFVSWLHPFKEHRFVAVGSDQMAVFDDTAPWQQKLALYPHQVDWQEGRFPVAREAERVDVPLDPVEPLRAECEAFLAAISGRKSPLTDGASGLRVLEVLAAGERSLSNGGAVMSVSEHGDCRPRSPDRERHMDLAPRPRDGRCGDRRGLRTRSERLRWPRREDRGPGEGGE